MNLKKKLSIELRLNNFKADVKLFINFRTEKLLNNSSYIVIIIIAKRTNECKLIIFFCESVANFNELFVTVVFFFLFFNLVSC